MLTTELMTIVEVPLVPTTVAVIPPPEETGETNNVELLPPLPMTTTVLGPLGITEAPGVETAEEARELVTTSPDVVKLELAAIKGVVSTDGVPTDEVAATEVMVVPGVAVCEAEAALLVASEVVTAGSAGTVDMGCWSVS